MILVHICCSVDSHFFLQKLQNLYPSKKLVGFFYDPNIHPYSEYYLRLLDVKRSCKILGIELIEGEYDFDKWLKVVRGFENEPEKGARCDLCFDRRLEISAKKAKEIGANFLTTTLLTSPKKSIEQLQRSGEKIADGYGLNFLTIDFRVKGGTQEQFKIAKENRLYHQDYCGCLYALTKQREQQERVKAELFMPISKQILPNSLEERIKLYNDRVRAEEINQRYEILREKFLNYRLLRAYLKENKEVIDSYILPYSTLKRKNVKFKIEKNIKNIYYANRENIIMIDLSTFNKLAKTNYKNIKEVIYFPLSFYQEIVIKNKIVNNFYSLSPIIIVENINQKAKYELFMDAKTYDDIKENLVLLG